MRPLLFTTLAVVALLLPGSLVAGTIYVDDDAPNDPGPGDPAVSDPLEDGSEAHPFDAIQEGIDAATGGDTVLVKDGTYTGDGNRDLDFGGRAITVRSENGPDKTIIDCQGTAHEQHRGLVFHSGETAASVVDGLTICRGWESEGGAIGCWNASSPVIANCVLVLNRAWGGGAVACTRGSSATIVGCTLVDNSATYGGGIYCDASAPIIRDCAVKENEAVYGGGIACWYGSDAAIRDSMIVQNEALSGGGGIYCCYDSNAAITNCAITDNWTGDYGGGLCSFESSAALMNCTLSSNTADTDGGALACYKGTFTFRNCILWDNSPREIQYNQADVTVTYCAVQDGTGEPWFDPATCIDADPLFVGGPLHEYYLSQTAAGQAVDSPCVDAGSDTAASLGLEHLTTRRDGGLDEGIVDMGYHAPPAPWIYSITRSGDDITIYWNGRSGVPYVVAWSDDRQTWNEIAVGEVVSWTDVGALVSEKRHFHVREDAAAPGAGSMPRGISKARPKLIPTLPPPQSSPSTAETRRPNVGGGGNMSDGRGNVHPK